MCSLNTSWSTVKTKTCLPSGARNKRQINTQNVFRQQREDRNGKIDDFNRYLHQQQKDFTDFLEGGRAKDIVSGWMRNPTNAPRFFKDWLEQRKISFLYSVIDSPFTWDEDLKHRITESVKKLGL